MTYKRQITGVQDSGASNRKYRKSNNENSNTSSSRNTEGNNNYYVSILINFNAH